MVDIWGHPIKNGGLIVVASIWSVESLRLNLSLISYVQRRNIAVPSAAYLSGYVEDHEEVPKISLECWMKAAGLIEKMGRGRLKKRKE